MNNEGRHDQSSGDTSGSETERVGKHADDRKARARPGPAQRRQVPPDDRLTTIIPAVTDDRSPGRADPIEEVKAALDAPASTPLHPAPPRRDPIDEVKAALDRPGSGRRPPPGEPPPSTRPPRDA